MVKSKFVERRSANFFYFTAFNTEDYKKIVKRYLEKVFEETVKIGEPYLIVDFYDGNPKTRIKPTGHVFIYDLEDRFNKFEEVCKYILSDDRIFIPVEVECSNKDDFKMLENILKENYGDKGKLTNGLMGLSRLFGMRGIKKK